MKKVLLIIGMIVLFVVACTPEETTPTEVPTSEPQAQVTNTIVLGDINDDNPIEKIEELQPIVDHLAANLEEFGITGGEVRIAPDIESMIALVEAGEVDMYYDSLYPAMIVGDATDSQPLVRGWRGGEPIYHSVFFVLADSGISSLEDLNGKMIALEDEGSTSGFMMPVSYLISNELNPVEKNSSESTVADDEVGYVFSEDDDNTIEWLLSGRVDVAVVDNLTYLSDIPEETQENLLIIAETEDVPRRVMMVGPNVEEELATAIATILMDMDETEEGLELLTIVKTAQFDEFPDGAEAAFEPIQRMFDVISNR